MPRSMRFITLAMIVFLIAELALVWLLRSRGWNGTATTLRTVGSILVIVLPLLAASAALFWNGRKITIRSILIAMLFLGIFLAIAAAPVIEASRARRGVWTLNRNQIRYGTHLTDPGGSYSPDGGRNIPAVIREEIPIWLKPLADDVDDGPRDEQIREVDLTSDDHIDVLYQVRHRFPYLEEIKLNGTRFSSEAMAKLAHCAKAMPKLAHVHIIDADLPPEAIAHLAFAKSITFQTSYISLGDFELNANQLRAISKLETLTGFNIVNYRIDCDAVQELAKLTMIEHITLVRTGLTTEQAKAFGKQLVKSSPHCKLYGIYDE